MKERVIPHLVCTSLLALSATTIAAPSPAQDRQNILNCGGQSITSTLCTMMIRQKLMPKPSQSNDCGFTSFTGV
jgi:hypothetical protein